MSLSRCSERGHVIVTAGHQADINIAKPQSVGADEDDADSKHDEIRGCLAQESLQNRYQNQRKGEGDKLFDDLYVIAFDARTRDKLGIERCRHLIIYGQLEHQEILESGGENAVRDKH